MRRSLGLASYGDSMAACIGGSQWFINLSTLNRPGASIRRWWSSLIQHTSFWALHLTLHLVLFLAFSSIWSEQELSWRAWLLGRKERKLGMNTNRISSKVMLSFYKYSCAIELEYSFHVIIMTYELAYSFYAMILTCATLCLIIHTICMIRSRAKLRWRFVVPLGLPMSYACRSVGSESQGDMGSFFVHRRGARVHRNIRI